jgi:tetratricopeptide (TPR) repeat protein
MVALAARWLIRNGRTEEGLLELDLLGKIERSNDWLALTISAQHGRHGKDFEITLLKEAVNVALGPEERSVAYRNLAYCYYGAQRREDSLATIRVFNAMQEADPDVARTLVILKWMNTADAQDFDEAFAIMKSEDDQEQICSWGALLMDRDLPESALELMKPLVEKDHPFGTIFSIECYLRKGDKESAYDTFQRIRPETLSDLKSRCGYAHVQALLVFLGGRDELRSKSIEDLKSVISAGIPQEQMFTEMLAGLESSHA